jgi:hypothetical protein
MKTRALIRRFARIWRGLRNYRPRFGPPPVPEWCTDARAETLLAELARSYPAGTALTLVEIERATRLAGIPISHGARYRRWLQSIDLWPYADRAGGFGRPGRRRRA